MQRRAALYARFSTELQSERSVEDQLDLCEAFAKAQGFAVAGRYADRARTGTTTIGREGLSSLLHDARQSAFEVVIVEALDRLSRDQEDLAGIHKRLSFLGIDIVAVHDGRADALQVGIRGLVSSLWIADLKHKIRRGMGGLVKSGKSAGGRSYGYRPTPGDPGKPIIHDEEAAVIRRIFADYVGGKNPRDIAGALNAEGIPGPRGARWSAATINGNTKRGNGILQNPLYAGRLIWNRVRMIRDPDTGRRVSRPNPPSEWQSKEVPSLAIIDPATWEAAQARKEGRAGPTRLKPVRHRKGILSGLLRCGKCGGGMGKHDSRGAVTRVRCTTHQESRSCDNTRRYRLDKIERAVLDGVAARLKDQSGLNRYIDGFQEERRAESAARARLEREVQAARGKIDRMARMLVDGRVPEDFFDKEMPDARAHLAALEARLAAQPDEKVVVLHPTMLAFYRKAFADLGQELASLDAREDAEIISAFRDLIDKVVIHDREDGSVECEVIGRLGPLLKADDGGSKTQNLVAEVRYTASPPVTWGVFRTDVAGNTAPRCRRRKLRLNPHP